jgi:diguanylate cyclase (GGDEF)-like protein
MTNDLRYSELTFLRIIAEKAQPFYPNNEALMKAVDVQGNMFVEMVATLVEDLHIEFHDDEIQLVVAKLRGELGPHYRASPSSKIADYLWDNPRQAIRKLLSAVIGAQTIRISYRGLRRIEELRDMLRSERILEEFGVLLSDRYFLKDLKDGLEAQSDIPVSVLYIDMDRFKLINDQFGHAAGDVVMKAYLQAIQDSVEPLGTAYRGRGDEVKAFIVGQEHTRAIAVAEKIRGAVENLQCKHKGKKLPKVTASIGVATTPPETRSADLEAAAEGRNRKAKEDGRNRVVAR